MTDAVVTLKKGEGRYLQKGGPWIYDNEIADISPGAEDGGLVRVCGENGWPLGQGFLNRRSKLTVRMLTRDPDAEINEDFFLMRLKNAWEYRKKVVDTSSCRLVFGEAEDLHLGELFLEHLGGAVGGSVVHHQDVVRGAGLGEDGLEALPQERLPVVGDDHGADPFTHGRSPQRASGPGPPPGPCCSSGSRRAFLRSRRP